MKIKLSSDISIDLDKLIESRLLIQANSGGGKSWANRRFIEQAFGHKQIIVIDPEGEFGNMRDQFDFVYIGKGGDAPAEPRSAALLARKLLETKASAIIDIYELGVHRKQFVKLFFEAMVNAPKELWHDCFIILDEAHKFAPEKEQSESLGAVVDMASLGRKRGFCLIPATQRPAKLNKDVAAECNNKLIGRASLDIDRKRSAEELGFNTKEEILSLRNLEPGEFYVFGPAISRDVVKTTIGDVQVKPPKRGTARSLRIAPPTAKVRKILAELADLPQAAEEEAKTTKELSEALRVAKRQIAALEKQPVFHNDSPESKALAERVLMNARPLQQAEINKAIKARDAQWKSLLLEWREMTYTLANAVEKAGKILESVPDMEYPNLEPEKDFDFAQATGINSKNVDTVISSIKSKIPSNSVPTYLAIPTDDMKSGEKTILKVIAGDSEGLTSDDIAILTGYKSTARYEHLRKLFANGYVSINGEKYFATEAGISALGSDYEPRLTGTDLQHQVLLRMPQNDEKKILEILIDGHFDRTFSKEDLQEMINKKSTATYEALRRLSAKKLITIKNGIIKASDKLFDL